MMPSSSSIPKIEIYFDFEGRIPMFNEPAPLLRHRAVLFTGISNRPADFPKLHPHRRLDA